MKPIKDLDFWSSLAIIFVTLCLMIATYLRWIQLHILVGPFFIDHWLVWVGTLYIAFIVPVFYVSKRRYPKRLTTLIRIHVFGNLFAFMLISVHFAQQIGRPPQFYPDLETGLILYIVMFILTITGFLHRFRIIRSVRPHINRFVHVSITMSFYIIIGFHILKGLKIL